MHNTVKMSTGLATDCCERMKVKWVCVCLTGSVSLSRTGPSVLVGAGQKSDGSGVCVYVTKVLWMFQFYGAFSDVTAH